MLLFITIIHFVISGLLIIFVLIQDSKGGGVFGMGSSGSNQVFSATGAANFLVKMTRGLAIAFAASCIMLTYITSRKASSVTDDYVPQAGATAPATTAPESAAPTSAPATEAPTDADKK